jgi:S1-C subfamily serine protease
MRGGDSTDRPGWARHGPGGCDCGIGASVWMSGQLDAVSTAVDGPPGAGGPPTRGRIRGSVLFLAGIAAALIGLGAYAAVTAGPAPLTRADVADTVAQVLASQTPSPPLAETAFAQVQRSIVAIESGTASTGAGPASLGSGIVVDDAGDILTALHVVAGSSTARVVFADGSSAEARVTSRHPDVDTAVLRPDRLPAGVVPAVLGDPGALRIGDPAFVVGNPFGLYASMSAGVVSGLGRDFRVPGTGQELTGLIQVDAAVNPGNSGGPLLDSAGRVVGIVTALINPTKEDVFVGIGLAVPIDAAGGAAGLPQY